MYVRRDAWERDVMRGSATYTACVVAFLQAGGLLTGGEVKGVYVLVSVEGDVCKLARFMRASSFCVLLFASPVAGIGFADKIGRVPRHPGVPHLVICAQCGRRGIPNARSSCARLEPDGGASTQPLPKGTVPAIGSWAGGGRRAGSSSPAQPTCAADA